MGKVLISLLLMFAGAAAFAGTLDGSSDEALTKSFVAEWQALNDADSSRLGMAVFSAFEQLRDMPAAQRNAKLNGKTVEEFIAIAKELSPDDFANNSVLFKKFSDKDNATDATVTRRFLAAVKPEKGFKAMLSTIEPPLHAVGGVVLTRTMAEALESLPPDKALLFLQVQDLAAKSPADGAELMNLLFTDGPNALMEKFKESNPADYAEFVKKIAALPPDNVAKMAKHITDQSRRWADDDMKDWEALDVPKPSELNWLTDFEAAKKQAAAESKPMFVLFTGSDWCPWCIKLERELLSSKAFGQYAKDSLVLVMVDFPRGKELTPEQTAANRKLSEQYDVSGFPTVLLMNAEGKVIGKSGYKKTSPEKYVESLKKMLNKK